MSATSVSKPTNKERSLPTVSFSLPHTQIERMREVAWARDVSVSQVAREALDLAFSTWNCADIDAALAGPPIDRRPTRWPRELRRNAARNGLDPADPVP